MKNVVKIFFYLSICLSLTNCSSNNADNPAKPDEAKKTSSVMDIADGLLDESLNELNAFLDVDAPTPTEAKKLSLSEGEGSYVPTAFANLPEANREDLKITGGPEVKYVLRNVMEPEGKFSLKHKDLRLNLASRAQSYSDAKWITGQLSNSFIQTIKNNDTFRFPILIGNDSFYRAEHICIANSKGDCEKDLSHLLKYKLRDIEGFNDENLFEKTSDESLPLFPILTIDTDSLRLKRGEKLLVKFMAVSHRGATFNIARPYRNLIHPGENPHMMKFIDDSLARYIERFSNNDSANMAHFITNIGIADCDMTALAVAQNRTPESEEKILIASGNRIDLKKQNIDLLTSNHSWNIFHNDTFRSLTMNDQTPAPSNVGLLFNSEIARWFKSQLENSNDLSEFSIFRAIEKQESFQITSDEINFDQITERMNQILNDLLEKGGYEVFSRTGLTDWSEYKNKKLYKSNQKGDVIEIVLENEISLAPLGSLALSKSYDRYYDEIIIKGPLTSLNNALSPGSLIQDFINHPDAVFYQVNMDGNLNFSAFETYLTSIREEKLGDGILWPSFITLTEREKFKADYFAKFPIDKGILYEGESENDFLSTVEYSWYDGIFGNKPGYYREFRHPSDQERIRFWRSKGFPVEPFYKITIKTLSVPKE